MTIHPFRPRTGENGFSLIEALVAASLLAVFFAAIFELNAMGLRSINASKEALAALQAVHDRSEALRNLGFSDLTNTATVAAMIAAPANQAPFLAKVTEVVKLSKYPTVNGVTQFTRLPNGTVTTNSEAADLGSGLVKVDVSISWTTTFGNRARGEQTTSIVSNGTKK